jgi:hypothetical protein
MGGSFFPGRGQILPRNEAGISYQLSAVSLLRQRRREGKIDKIVDNTC